MDPASIISLIAIAVVAIFTSVTAPLILSHRTERMHREDQLEQYRREDQVAHEAKAASTALLSQQTEAATAARMRDEESARYAAADRRDTSDKLDVIHGLVNSTLSAAMQSELDALITSAAMMREVMDLKRATGSEPTAEAVIAFQATEAKISELRVTLADRMKQGIVASDVHAASAAKAKKAAEKGPIPVHRDLRADAADEYPELKGEGS